MPSTYCIYMHTCTADAQNALLRARKYQVPSGGLRDMPLNFGREQDFQA